MLLQPRESQGPIPLSAQQSLGLQWLSQQQGINFKLRGTAIRILGQLDATALSTSLDAMIRRHEALRTRIVAIDGIHRQHVDPPAADSLQSIDLTHESPADAWQEARSIGSALYAREVDVAVGPLFEAKLLKLRDDDHALIMVMNHLISDAVSCEILNRELWTLYAQAERGAPLHLPPVGLQYGDYSVWQERMHELWRKRHEAYWRGRFQNAVAPRIPMEGFAETERPVTAMLHFALGSKLSEQLRDMARCKQVPLPLLVLVAYVVAMSHWCDQQDLVVVLAYHGRQRQELKNVIGFFASELTLRVEVAPGDSFLDLLDKIGSRARSGEPASGLLCVLSAGVRH